METGRWRTRRRNDRLEASGWAWSIL